MKKPKTHVILRTDRVLTWREYCKENGYEYHDHLENIMEKLATGEAALTSVHYVKANFKFEVKDET